MAVRISAAVCAGSAVSPAAKVSRRTMRMPSVLASSDWHHSATWGALLAMRAKNTVWEAREQPT